MNYYKINFINGNILVLKSLKNKTEIEKWAFYEFGTDFTTVKIATEDDINWFARNNGIREI